MANNATHDKRLLILTGPQGSGNHLFSRIFSMHPLVNGWEALKERYWVPSDQEPFAEYWVYPERFDPVTVMAQGEYFLANVSAPFFYDGVRQFPRIADVALKSQAAGIAVTVAIVCRDYGINFEQQKRVGGEATIVDAMTHYRALISVMKANSIPVHFVSHESLFMWQQNYVEYLARTLDFPVDLQNWNHQLNQSPNLKYVQAVDHHWLDDTIRAGRRTFAERIIERLKEK